MSLQTHIKEYLESQDRPSGSSGFSQLLADMLEDVILMKLSDNLGNNFTSVPGKSAGKAALDAVIAVTSKSSGRTDSDYSVLGSGIKSAFSLMLLNAQLESLVFPPTMAANPAIVPGNLVTAPGTNPASLILKPPARKEEPFLTMSVKISESLVTFVSTSVTSYFLLAPGTPPVPTMVPGSLIVKG